MYQIPKKEFDSFLATMLANNTEDVRTLLVSNGFSEASDMGSDDVSKMFLKAVKDSDQFRKVASEYMATLAKKSAGVLVAVEKGLNFIPQPQFQGFVSQPSFQGFVEQPAFQGFVAQPAFQGFNQKKNGSFKNVDGDWWDDYNSPVSTTSTNTSNTSTPTTTTTTKSTGSFWDSLAGVASKENLSNLFNTGLGVLGNKLNADSTKASEERALELERIRLEQIRAAQQGGGGANATPGLSTGAIVGIAIGGIVVIGTIIYLVAKK